MLAAGVLGTGCLVGDSMERDPAEVMDDPFVRARQRMVREQIEARGIRDPRVLEAMRRVPRHLFVPEPWRSRAYEDGPLPIGEGQTISQPYIVAFMTEALRPRSTDRILEVGTGSGYQAAVLASIVARVFTVEILPGLGEQARRLLHELNYDNVEVRIGDGHAGWPEHAPFDAIIVTAAPEEVPPALIDQLVTGGRLVIPVGRREQHLIRLTRTAEGVERETLLPVRFVPLTGGGSRPD
ncbi:MAG: protein-L-isoaspartate(D-aspartate) O-methyltransferase [Acidobacteriota bacterium]